MIGGYRNPDYAKALGELGTPLRLPRSQGSLLVRPIGAGPHRDAMGTYPLFSCSDWEGLRADLDDLGGELVSVGLVTDPFGEWSPALLERAFPEWHRPFKEHFVVALEPDPLRRVSAHHRRFAARGLRRVGVEAVAQPPSMLDEWVRLYDELIRRHTLAGVAAFSADSFARQLAVPGMVAFRAMEADAAVGATLWYVDRGVAYWHLAAYSGRGYEVHASYALLGAALEHFAATGVSWASLGAGAGARADSSDGLSWFKAGWASGTRPVHFCGRILDRGRYDALSTKPTSFFPAYRA